MRITRYVHYTLPLLGLISLISINNVPNQIDIYPSQKDARAIGKRIWHNECAGSYDQLTWWSKLEPFPSFGIGHFIWYPQGQTGSFTQIFPDYIRFMQKHGKDIPLWLEKAKDIGCPWLTREEFYRDFSSERMQELRTLLSTTIDLQTLFIIQRFYQTIPDIISHAQPSNRRKIKEIITKLSQIPEGVYALVDYLNFKGAGTNPKERYHNQGWGLLQVVEHMLSKNMPITSQSFAISAEYVLRRRITNAPAESTDGQRLAGWLNRLKTYTQPL